METIIIVEEARSPMGKSIPVISECSRKRYEFKIFNQQKFIEHLCVSSTGICH